MIAPATSWENFAVYENSDRTFHILVVAGSGGYVFADNIGDRQFAEWAANALNAALRRARGGWR
jgi:hypothetical protein